MFGIKWNERWDAWALTGLGCWYLALLFGLVIARTDVIQKDAAIYLAMARDPWIFTAGPHGYRLLTPLLVHLLPVDPLVGFSIVTLVSLVLTIPLLQRYLRAFGLTRTGAALGISLFLCSGGIVIALQNPLLVDPLTWLFLVLALLGVVMHNPGLFAVSVAVGTLNKETMLFVLPLWYTETAHKSADWWALRRTALLALPAVTAFLVPRLMWGGAGLVETYFTWEGLARVWQHHLNPYISFEVFGCFGLVWWLAFTRWREGYQLLRGMWLFEMLVVGQLAFATDEARLLAYLFPVLIPRAAMALEEGLTRCGWLWCTVMIVACELSTINWRWTVVPNRNMRYILVAGGTLGGLALWVWKVWCAAKSRKKDG